MARNSLMKTHKDLDVWNKAIDFVSEIYSITKTFPGDERYGIVAQIRRSAISIPSNIAEGSARSSKKEFIQFLYIALGSASELHTQIIISKNLGYLNESTDIIEKIEDIQKMLMGLIKFLRK